MPFPRIDSRECRPSLYCQRGGRRYMVGTERLERRSQRQRSIRLMLPQMALTWFTDTGMKQIGMLLTSFEKLHLGKTETTWPASVRQALMGVLSIVSSADQHNIHGWKEMLATSSAPGRASILGAGVAFAICMICESLGSWIESRWKVVVISWEMAG